MFHACVLYASSRRVSHWKESIPFSQTLRFNRICSENAFFDKQWNELEVWLKKNGYRDKLGRRQILKARKFSISEDLNKRKSVGNNNRFVSDINYPVLSELKNLLSKIRLLLILLLDISVPKGNSQFNIRRRKRKRQRRSAWHFLFRCRKKVIKMWN